MLEKIYTSTKTLPSDLDAEDDFLLYSKAFDAMVMYYNGNLYKVFRDGTYCFFGGAYTVYWSPLARENTSFLWHCSDPFETNLSRKLFKSDEITFQPQVHEIVNPNWNVIDNVWAYKAFVDIPRNIIIAPNTMDVYGFKCRNLTTGEILWSVPMINYNYTTTINYVDKDHIVILEPTTGLARFVNINTGIVVDSLNFDVSLQATYDCNHGLIVAVDSNKKINLYLKEPYPQTLSGITLISEYGLLAAYLGCNIRVRLTDSNGTPCPNRPIYWSLPNSVGSLEKSVSYTNLDGYSFNFHYGPIASGGTENIKAEWG